MGYEKKLTCTNYFIKMGKKDFQECTPKIQILMFGRTQMSHFGLWDIPPPYENTHAKGLVGTQGWGGGGMTFKKKNSISYMYNTKSDHYSHKIKL